jgi:adenylyltransferase/sulfurtransferase
MQFDSHQFFKRQTTLKEVGESGQQKLQNTKVLVVGCGGLGSPIAVYLAMSGIGNIHLVDFDKVDVTNLHRQVFYSLEDIGKPKAAALADFIKRRNPFTEISFTTKPVTKSNVLQLIANADIIVDGTDSLPTKYLLNDTCVMQNKPLVYGSLYKFDGYVATFNAKQKDESYSGNLRDAFPTMATDIPNCEEAGTLNAIIGIIATMQVNEVLKLALNIGNPLINQIQIVNALQNSSLKMKLKSTFSKERIAKIFNKEDYFDIGCQVTDEELTISPLALQKLIIEQKNTLEIIAVLPNLDLPFSVQKTIPINTFDAEQIDIDYTKTYVMVCQRGKNSLLATQKFKAVYPNATVLSLDGGIFEYNTL